MLWDPLVNQELLAKLVRLDFLEHLELKETWVPLVTREVLVCRVPEVRLENLVCLVNQEGWVPLVRMVPMEKKVVQEIQEHLVLQDFQDQEVSQDSMEVLVPQVQKVCLENRV